MMSVIFTVCHILSCLLSIIMPNVIVPSVEMLNVECCYAECHYAECRYTKCNSECRYVECRYAECRYAKCCGTIEVVSSTYTSNHHPYSKVLVVKWISHHRHLKNRSLDKLLFMSLSNIAINGTGSIKVYLHVWLRGAISLACAFWTGIILLKLCCIKIWKNAMQQHVLKM